VSDIPTPTNAWRVHAEKQQVAARRRTTRRARPWRRDSLRAIGRRVDVLASDTGTVTTTAADAITADADALAERTRADLQRIDDTLDDMDARVEAAQEKLRRTREAQA
jgi:hypothetical protein